MKTGEVNLDRVATRVADLRLLRLGKIGEIEEFAIGAMIWTKERMKERKRSENEKTVREDVRVWTRVHMCNANGNWIPISV